MKISVSDKDGKASAEIAEFIKGTIPDLMKNEVGQSWLKVGKDFATVGEYVRKWTIVKCSNYEVGVEELAGFLASFSKLGLLRVYIGESVRGTEVLILIHE